MVNPYRVVLLQFPPGLLDISLVSCGQPGDLDSGHVIRKHLDSFNQNFLRHASKFQDVWSQTDKLWSILSIEGFTIFYFIHATENLEFSSPTANGALKVKTGISAFSSFPSHLLTFLAASSSQFFIQINLFTVSLLQITMLQTQCVRMRFC